MEDADPVVDPDELGGSVGSADPGSHQDKNLAILKAFAERPRGTKSRKLHLRFLVSPSEVLADVAGGVCGLKLERNRLEIRPDGAASARGTGVVEMLDVGMVLPSIGFSLEQIDGVPYDARAGIIANEDGRVIDAVSRKVIANEYVVGWARTGAQGLIGSHKAASAHVVAHMFSDRAEILERELPNREAIVSLLHERGVQSVSFSDWKQLDDVEVARGERRDAPRDKIVDVETMLAILAQN
jgi:ferredoxin--NADP+ reductase